ncbi:60S ribosomal protein L4, mitochondrial precursor [Sporothrix brasiliensis 5110]|uniref:Large ribosomal subunit protein uL4m n=1 Tax=Sporothrix brasiliensis 5110 TaxID=1398154 RepID=A0A0C2JBU7_9PEZI|nr:60S ribosomal protein L4, mitochondrial precursor [Sporothrix brasiliensis 5110]KIH94377.1 60S ribosomal protein L4, mitochondrial precursor [Sporothrix brasiliensis 5110]
MAARRGAQSLSEAFYGLTLSSQTGRRALVPRAFSTSPSQNKPLATTPRSASPAASSSASSSSSHSKRMPSSFASTVPPAATAPTTVQSITERTVPVTVFAFPSLEPRALELWPAQHLQLPLRRDLLHLAVVYEGDNTRQGTASSKTRWDVHGSHRKMRRQKGSGMARVGTRQSPLIRGGGKTFGPHPRDFGTDLNRKMYDRAWRTALSYRYRRGELIVCEDGLELPLPDAFLRLAQAGTLDRSLEDGFVKRYVRSLLNGEMGTASTRSTTPLVGGTSDVVPGIAAAAGTGIGSIGQAWGRLAGRTTFITTDRRPNLFTSLETAGEDGRALAVADVDVKDLLETGRIVVERAALHEMIDAHQSDLVSRIYIQGAKPSGLATGQTVIG